MAPKRKNGFLLFCEDYRQQHSEGASNMSLKAATEIAGPLWNKLTEFEKERYREKAKLTASTTKYSALGTSIDYVQKIENEKKAYELNIIEKIAVTVQNMCATNSLQYLDICIFHVNTFCYVVSHKRHFPAELAVAKFNLRDGVWDVYHALCHPGPIPLGYAATIQTKSDETHQLLPPLAAASNLEKIFSDLISFIGDSRNRSKPPPVYVAPNNYEIAKEFLTAMCVDFGYDPYFLEAYPLSHLFHQMRNGAARNVVFPSVTLAVREFERDVYEYATNISCSVHEALGVQNHCSKSFVTRMAYIICDHCCKDMKIELIAGKHVAFKAKVSSTRTLTETSDYDNDKYSRRRKKCESSLMLSDTSEELRFSCISDDDTLSLSSVTSNLRNASLDYDEQDADVSSSSRDLEPLDFKSCSYNESDDQFFVASNSSQASSVSFAEPLNQNSAYGYGSNNSLVLTPTINKGRGRVHQFVFKK